MSPRAKTQWWRCPSCRVRVGCPIPPSEPPICGACTKKLTGQKVQQMRPEGG